MKTSQSVKITISLCFLLVSTYIIHNLLQTKQVLPISTIDCISYEPSKQARPKNIGDDVLNLIEVEKDFSLLKEHTNCLRFYKSSGDYGEASILASKYGFNVIQGIWLNSDKENNKKELKNFFSLLEKHPTIKMVVVGNETQLFETLSKDDLLEYIRQVSEKTQIPITTGESASFYIDNQKSMENIDIIGIQTFPYWENVTIDQSLYFFNNLIEDIRFIYKDKPIFILETGWPSLGQNRKNSITSIKNQREFLAKINTWTKDLNINYNIIEAFDQEWKIKNNEGISGGHWGIWKSDRTDKLIRIKENIILLNLFLFFIIFPTNIYFLIKKDLSIKDAFIFSITHYLAFGVLIYCVVFLKEMYLLLSPISWLFYIGINTLLLLASIINSQLIYSSEEEKPSLSLPNYKKPFVSIIIATSNEDPELVKETVNSALDQDYDNFEVILFDNNTKNDALWMPLKNIKHPKLKFLHEDYIDGFKAGALNHALLYVSNNTEAVAFVDADYILEKNFISYAMQKLVTTDTNIAGIQFPQTYRKKRCDLIEVGATKEQDFFGQLLMPIANKNNALILNGTMLVIKYYSLKKVNFFETDTICEDTDLGIRLLQNGYTFIFDKKILGKGIAPQNFNELTSQRMRWVIGSMQLIKKHIFNKNTLNKKQKTFFIFQWFLWIIHIFYPIFIVLSVIGTFFILKEERYILPFEINLYALSYFSICLLIFFYLSKKLSFSLKEIFSTIIVGGALSITIAEGVFRGIFTKNNTFKQTRNCSKKSYSVHYAFICMILIIEIIFLQRKYNFQYVDTTVWIITIITLLLPIIFAFSLSIQDNLKLKK